MKTQLITVTRWSQKFCLGGTNLNNQARSGKPETMNSEAVLQVIQTNLASSTLRVSVESNFSLSSVGSRFHDFDKSIQSCQIGPHDCKILKKKNLVLWTSDKIRPDKNYPAKHRAGRKKCR